MSLRGLLEWEKRSPSATGCRSLFRLAPAGAPFLLITSVAKRLGFFSPKFAHSLKTDWQSHVLASSGYLELGMFDDAALALEEITPENKTRNEVLGARVNLYMAAKSGYGSSGCGPPREG